MKKFLKLIFILLISVLFATTFYFVKADDDNETEEREEEDEKDEEDEEDDEDYKPKTTTKTIITQPSVSTKVETTTKTTIYKDSDGDGILDGDDPHPEIAEIYIVEDNNKNGIVDKFE